MHATRGAGVAEDKGGSPLPRRVPGTKRGPGTGPLARPVLSDSDLHLIRAALDSAQAQVPAPAAELSAPLPQRAPEAGNGSEPSVPIGRVELPAAFLHTPPKKARTESPPAVPAPRPGAGTEETERRPDAAAQPGQAPPAGPPLVPAQRAPAEERDEQQDQPEEEKASPEQEKASRKEAPAVPANGQASLGKAQLHGTKALTRRPKQAAPETPPPPPRAAPPKPAPPTAPAPTPAPAGPRKRGRGRAIITGSAIVTLVLLSAGSALLLTRHGDTTTARTDA